MATPAICPKCESPTTEGVCRQCAFSAALMEVNTVSADGSHSSASFAAPEGYELIHELGSGATAVVWLARERKLDRLVAVKFISNAADRRLTQRLAREGQAVARLRHPNIVAVHAMDATSSHAYLVMDFLEGGDLRQRLALGLPALQQSVAWVSKLAGALAHAHEHALLHRDIKPSNVLLDAGGEPHLADFGLVSPLEGGGDLTLPGQVAGTAAYLAPELLAGADRASPVSDIYSLGAVLYECLTGRPPFLGDSTASIFGQLAKVEPPAPRLLRPNIPRDLETICLKCLEKTPARRYASAQALQADIERIQRGEPIAARPITSFEKAVRWARRHPSTAAFASLAAALLLGLAIGGPLVALRLSRAQAEAAAEAASSKAVSDFLQNDLLAQAAPDQQTDRDLKLRTVLDRAAKNLNGRFVDQPLVEADVRATLATTYFSLGEYASAHEHGERARLLRERVLGPTDRKTLAAAAQLFDTLRAQGIYPEAEKLGVEVLAQQRRVLGPLDPDTQLSMSNLAILRRNQGKYADAEALYVEALDVQRKTVGPDSPETLTVMNNLAVVYRNQGKLAEAEKLHAETLERRTRVLGPEHPDTLHSLSNLSIVYKDLGRLPEAEKLATQAVALRERVLGPEHPYTLISMITLAAILADESKLEEAENLSVRALEIQQRRLGHDHPETLNLMNNLGTVYRDRGKLIEAEKILTDTVSARRRVLGPEHQSTLNSMAHLARVYEKQHRIAEALVLTTGALEIAKRVRGPSHPFTVKLTELHDRLVKASKP